MAQAALAGLRVIECGEMVAAAYATKLLADLGAEVIKIEPPGEGDPMRQMGPPFLEGPTSAYFLATNRNKKSVTIDLTKPSQPGFHGKSVPVAKSSAARPWR